MAQRPSGGYAHIRIAHLYDYVPAYRTRRDLDFYLEEATASGGPVLELGCGTGRVLLPIARTGVEITGLDLAEPMLEVLDKKLSRETKEIQDRTDVVHGDMRHFELGKTFALVIVPFRTFQHLITVEDQISCLECINRHLSPEGKLILDFFQTNPRMMFDAVYTQETEDFSGVALPDGTNIRRTHRTVAFHRAEQYNDTQFIYYVTHPDGRMERLVQAFPFRYFFRYEVEHLLARCGFTVTALFGDFDRSPLDNDSPEMIFAAEKTADALH